MAQPIKKENMVIVLREYTDNQGQAKKVYKTIGELVTWKGDDGSNYQSFEAWGAGGVVQGKIFDQQDNNQNNNQAQQNNGFQQQAPQQQQGGFQQQGGYNQNQGGFNNQ